MPAPQTIDTQVVIKFGGGVNSAASEDEVGARECTYGQNFVLDYKNTNLRPRKAIRKVGSAPNGQSIDGFVNLVKANGEASILVQAGTTVYSWSGTMGFVSVGTVPANCKLRGHLYHYWPLEDLVLITDLNLNSPVLTWNGSALATMGHNLPGDFRAKYCTIDSERARFYNVISDSSATPHMVVTSEVSDYSNLSVSDRPSSALGAADPYYILTPDLRPINGAMGFFNSVLVSTDKGSLFNIVGTDATDTQIENFYPRSFAYGDESLSYIGNDVILGRIGRIESVVATDSYGDIALNDLTIPIKPDIADQTDWLMAYNPRTQKVYVYADGEAEIWQYSKDIAPDTASPWVRLVTAAGFGMAPTAMMTLIDPDDGLEYVFMGDDSGNVYVMEGEYGQPDAGANDITTIWRSRVYRFSPDFVADEFDGYVSYRAGQDTEITVKFLFGGSFVQTDTSIVPLKGEAGGSYFGGEIYFGGDYYFGTSFGGAFRREEFTPSGNSEEFQIEISHTGTVDFEVNEIGVKFKAKTNP
jgi:hypothetical protein